MYNVLLVDPNDFTLHQTTKLIKRLDINFKVTNQTNQYHNVTQLIENHRFSLIVINIKGYNTTGILLCKKIRSKSRIPIILIGGKDDFQLARKALTYQINDYLTEPMREGTLKTSLLAVKKALTINSSYEPNDGPTSTVAVKKNEPSISIIETVKHYVQNDMHQNITLKKISSILHFNCAYLGQKFRLHENMSFNAYLLQQRMEKAKVLLKKTDMKIYEIANEVGYTEIDWFYKKFKQYTGLSSNEYRKKYDYSQAN
ncbi:helix-turn-helix domain-containing protein [Paenibacillus endoradicis]|uniref:helix-turn-helix domain-containing protein n=1 Tax=Paenibacillus endoradicis TaxID=2972487 RepID=UPI0021595028|nr:helix-turn-helix domain-containing protein [Paenibacillus endoradicis]MCR8655934.1 helix-turn-helix domain-containing protein [Paenibacillus endoradicis]MCR8658260.1 helix-turn-helix domain-containing protein [Paenibacillus endoradicis]